MLTNSEYQRYSRHLNLPNFGESEQLALRQAKVLVVGAGGLGCPLLSYLAAAGVGTIGIIDYDVVDISNLQRQVLYTTDHIGLKKADVAGAWLQSQNPLIDIHIITERLTPDNALSIIADYDIVADGTDNFPTRYLVNDSCVILDKINVYASIYQYEGQVSVFNYPLDQSKRGPNYRDLYPNPPEDGLVPDCASGGVLGVLAGTVGTYQASQVITCITGIGEPLIGRLLIYDALDFSLRKIIFANESKVKVTKLIDYDLFCGTRKNTSMNEITATELKAWRDENKDHQLIDVREDKEVNFASIGGDHIVLGDILARKDEIATDKPVVIMCRSGKRSGAAVNALTQNGFDNIYNLKGGILAWAQDVDNSVPTY